MGGWRRLVCGVHFSAVVRDRRRHLCLRPAHRVWGCLHDHVLAQLLADGGLAGPHLPVANRHLVHPHSHLHTPVHHHRAQHCAQCSNLELQPDNPRVDLYGTV